MKLNLEFDPCLVERVVPLALKRLSQQHSLHRVRSRASAGGDPDKEDLPFRDFRARSFRRLGLAKGARRAILESGKSLSGVSLWKVRAASSQRQCGAELIGADGSPRLVVVRIPAAVMADESEALAFFRRELLHVADMLDSAFEYQPRLPASPLGPPESRRIQDRYSLLWRCSVEGRLVREGKLPAECRNRCLAQFRILFPSLEDSTQECFEKIFGGPRPLHSVFVALATEPELAFGLPRRSTQRRRSCPTHPRNAGSRTVRDTTLGHFR